MKNFVADVASTTVYELGESPVWDAARQRLLWVDINQGKVFTGSLDGLSVVEDSALVVDETVGAVVPGISGDFLVAGRHSLHRLSPDGDQSRLLRVIAGDKRSRLNDGACDPAGRFLVGSVGQAERKASECLYRWDGHETVSVIDDGLTISNGLAWSLDGTVMYSVDSIPGIVFRRSYDAVSGQCGEREEWLRFKDGLPDGACLDVLGNLWVATWGTGQIRCFQPDGTHVATVNVDAPLTTSVAFVGADRDLLLITTARDELGPEERAAHPDSGRLFIADVGVAGHPPYLWNPDLIQPQPRD